MSIVLTIATLIIANAAPESKAKDRVGDSNLLTRYYTTVSQRSEGGKIATMNTLHPYETGYKIVKEGEVCWKIVTTQTGTKKLPTPIRNPDGIVELQLERPILSTSKEPIECVYPEYIQY